MFTAARHSKRQPLVNRVQALVTTANELIADIESDIAAPGEAAFHAKDAYAALNRAHNALLTAATDVEPTPYIPMASALALVVRCGT